MKNYLKITLVILGLGLLCSLGYQVITKIMIKNDITAILKVMPEFSFEDIEGQIFTQKNIDPDNPTVFIYFNSECDYCQYEAQSIQENVDKLRDIQIVFVSNETNATVQKFAERYKLNIYEQIYFLSDTKDHFTSRFDATAIPYFLMYSKDKNLIKRHKGQLQVEQIMAILNPVN